MRSILETEVGVRSLTHNSNSFRSSIVSLIDDVSDISADVTVLSLLIKTVMKKVMGPFMGVML